MSRLRSLLDAHPAIRSLYEEALKLSDAEVRAMGELLTAAGTERSSFMDQAAWRFAQSVFDEPANRRCADCGSAQLVTWASMLVLGEAAAGVATHAVVLCNQCCGGHRPRARHLPPLGRALLKRRAPGLIGRLDGARLPRIRERRFLIAEELQLQFRDLPLVETLQGNVPQNDRVAVSQPVRDRQRLWLQLYLPFFRVIAIRGSVRLYCFGQRWR